MVVLGGNMEWYANKKVRISFDKVPLVSVRYFVPSMSEQERKSIEKYPFINKRDLQVTLEDLKKGVTYSFTIPKDYCFDGASIPKMFHRVIGANTDNRFLIPAMVHDQLCENHHYINNDRVFSSEVFNALLEANEVNSFKRWLMKNSVNTFQVFCGW